MAKSKTPTAHMPAKAVKWGISRHALLVSVAVVAGGALLAWTLPASMQSASTETITVWQSPTHSCCPKWVSYMRRRGYRVTVNNVADTIAIKAGLGIPDALYSCHTAKIGDYVIEGHVPAPAIARLLDERPELKGIALPGMPAGPPGMGGSPGVYGVVGFTADGRTRQFADAGI